MRNIVLDTNCLLYSIGASSPFHNVWESYVKGEYYLCVTNDILEEYEEILTQKTSSTFAKIIIKLILEHPTTRFIRLYYQFNLIEADKDDNKFVDCAIAANAEYIVSNDSHFKILETISFPHLNVLSIEAFSHLLSSHNNL